MFRVELLVRPKSGVRDPQGEAVEEALRGLGYDDAHVHHVGRTLRLDVKAPSADAARAMVEEMCKKMLVNPNLETHEIVVTPTQK